MTLLIDAGNSAVKWAALVDGGTFVATGRQLHRDGADIESSLSAAWRSLERPARAVGCSVAGRDVMAAIERAVRSIGLDGVDWLRSQRDFRGPFTLVNGYRDPAQLGPDRWHAVLGACARLPGASFVVASAGTATTVDCVRAAPGIARFVGGCIAPGFRLMLESLSRGTAGLPLADGEADDFPDTTDRAIVTGVLDAQAGLVERVFRRFAAALGAPPRLLLAGGHADTLAARLPVELAPIIEHNLVLRGLALRDSHP
ncbi:MAG: type III pantothenate kinase [Burkholderiaceae bacterium]|nr:type III pantothenate kinase [Burkholderiaceae bacterium]